MKHADAANLPCAALQISSFLQRAVASGQLLRSPWDAGMGMTDWPFCPLLPAQADKLFLYEHFAPLGAILSVRVLTDDTGDCRGVGFVNYADPRAARQAGPETNGKQSSTFDNTKTRPSIISQSMRTNIHSWLCPALSATPTRAPPTWRFSDTACNCLNACSCAAQQPRTSAGHNTICMCRSLRRVMAAVQAHMTSYFVASSHSLVPAVQLLFLKIGR